MNNVASIIFKRLKDVIIPESDVSIISLKKKSHKGVVLPTSLPLSVSEDNISPMKFPHG